LATHRIAATHVKSFTRDLPRVLCQWPRTRMVVVPSQQETFSNIPLEVALWARQQGPIVVASRVGGFVDQIEDGVTGFFSDLTSCEAMGQTLQHVLDLSAEQQAVIRRQACEKVVRLYDFQRNFPATLRWFWGMHTSRPAALECSLVLYTFVCEHAVLCRSVRENVAGVLVVVHRISVHVAPAESTYV